MVGQSVLPMAGLSGKKEGDKKTALFLSIALMDNLFFMAAIGSTPFERGDEAEGFLIVTAAADRWVW